MRMYLVEQRFKLDYSINHVCRLTGMDKHHYRRIETGKIERVGFVTFCQIASVLEISFEELFEKEVEYLTMRNK